MSFDSDGRVAFAGKLFGYRVTFGLVLHRSCPIKESGV